MFQKLLQFLRSPDQYPQENIPASQKFGHILRLLSWAIASVVPLSIILTLILEYLKYAGVNAVDELIKTEKIVEVLILATILGPLLEETIFRLSLRFNPVNLGISSFIALKLVTGELPQALIANPSMQWIISFTGSILVFLFASSKKGSTLCNTFYHRQYRLIFYTLTIIFGYVHLLNYSDLQTLNAGALLVLAIPQVIVGAFLGYIRIFYGFKWGVLFHGLYNLSIILPALLLENDDKSLLIYGEIAAAIFLGFFLSGVVSLLRNTYTLVRK